MLLFVTPSLFFSNQKVSIDLLIHNICFHEEIRKIFSDSPRRFSILMSTHNICIHGEIKRKCLNDVPSYLEIWEELENVFLYLFAVTSSDVYS